MCYMLRGLHRRLHIGSYNECPIQKFGLVGCVVNEKNMFIYKYIDRNVWHFTFISRINTTHGCHTAIFPLYFKPFSCHGQLKFHAQFS